MTTKAKPDPADVIGRALADVIRRNELRGEDLFYVVNAIVQELVLCGADAAPLWPVVFDLADEVDALPAEPGYVKLRWRPDVERLHREVPEWVACVERRERAAQDRRWAIFQKGGAP